MTWFRIDERPDVPGVQRAIEAFDLPDGHQITDFWPDEYLFVEVTDGSVEIGDVYENGGFRKPGLADEHATLDQAKDAQLFRLQGELDAYEHRLRESLAGGRRKSWLRDKKDKVKAEQKQRRVENDTDAMLSQLEAAIDQAEILADQMIEAADFTALEAIPTADPSWSAE